VNNSPTEKFQSGKNQTFSLFFFFIFFVILRFLEKPSLPQVLLLDYQYVQSIKEQTLLSLGFSEKWPFSTMNIY